MGKSEKTNYEYLLEYVENLEHRIENIEKENDGLKLAASILRYMGSNGSCTDSHSKIIKDICELWGVDIHDIFTLSRKRDVVEARHVIMFALRYNTTLTLSQIGDIVSGRNHSTVSHAVKMVNQLASIDKTYLNRLITLNLDKWLITD